MNWNKVYRGGVQRTTPETREVDAPKTGTLLPGMAIHITEDKSGMVTGTGVAPATGFFYILGQQLHGSINENQAGQGTMRMYSPSSGELYVARAAEALGEIYDDLPLTFDAEGRAAKAGEEDTVHAYVDAPANAFPSSVGAVKKDQLIPIKIK